MTFTEHSSLLKKHYVYRTFVVEEHSMFEEHNILRTFVTQSIECWMANIGYKDMGHAYTEHFNSKKD